MTGDKSNIVLHYNINKGGTDTYDKLCHSYSVRKRSNRWPARYFYGILDQAIVNARILLACKAVESGKNEKITAISCLESLYFYLVKPHLEQRLSILKLSKELKFGIRSILKKSETSVRPITHVNLVIKKRCSFCTRVQDKKTDKACGSCSRPICPNHRFLICQDCAGAWKKYLFTVFKF